MKRLSLLTLSALALIGTSPSFAAALPEKASIGIVNFTKCITDSTYGKQEQTNFENVRTQLNKTLEDLEKQLGETQNKLSNQEILDSLSPEAEKELHAKLKSLNDEMGRYQAQYSQILQQANMQIVQKIMSQIQKASDQVAKKHSLEVVLNKDVAFFFAPSLDVTDEVIVQMNQNYDANSAKGDKK
ncbi:MAG: hypothetical protein A3F09_03020 [Chlamydiae bacterium RIFCSPHIGHO2_12_FULL_49_11]|nr:MAG: hypothetical protein A3F09_03020 [Chlamydiae bacterium RIFCSPHIGHO2_12_FULL_49_11]